MKNNILSEMLSVWVANFGLAKIMSALVASQGRDNILRALGVKPGQKSKPKTAPKPRVKPDAVSAVAAMDLDDAAKKEFLAHLAKKYEAKEFMPNVNHVRTFLMYHTKEDPAKIKSRQQITVKIFKKMAEMSLEELRELKYCGMYDPPKRLAAYADAIENYGREMRASRHSRD